MAELKLLLDRNRAWSERRTHDDPAFFERLAAQQSPEYFWIGCSDARVPANEIVDMPPGDVFVHRNVANLVVHTDLNCLTALQFAVDVLHVKHVIVCGHYGCVGIEAAAQGQRLGLADNWLRHVRDVQEQHERRLVGVPETERTHRLCELNVLAQALNACRTTIVQDAWQRGRDLTVHSWAYGIRDGRIRDLGFSSSTAADCESHHVSAVERAISGAPRG